MKQRDSKASKSSLPGPLAVLKEAIRAVPAVKYALGVAGILSALAIITVFHESLAVAGLGAVVMFLLMTVLVIFARLVKADDGFFRKPMYVLMWASLVLLLVVASLFVSCVFFRVPLDLASFVTPKPTHHLTVSNLHADCSQHGFCTIEVEVANNGNVPEKVTGFKYYVVDYKSFGTLGGLEQPDLIGDLDLSDQTKPSTVWRYAHRRAVDVLDPARSGSLVLKVTARDLAKGFGLWTLRPVLETSTGELPLQDIQLMLPYWDTQLLSQEGG